MAKESRLSDLEARAIVMSIIAVGSVSEMILATVKGIGKKRARELVVIGDKPLRESENDLLASVIAENKSWGKR